ncbi:hypothetical protein NEILACOT_04334 [Neisseria lactamica ATCC 23970]|uniref:Uncharacterized protein n=1 Tax=Neisseria lactamica ATCC 23970 TaxID=546265 RepID=D0W9X1_NEILA|nr:hypothetical protein NEILACOT_04334 [Neisseria lactamica ATCC 23970]
MGFSPPTPPFHQPNPTQTSQSANPIISAVFRRHRFVGTRRRVTAQVRLSDLSDWWAEAHPTTCPTTHFSASFPRRRESGPVRTETYIFVIPPFLPIQPNQPHHSAIPAHNPLFRVITAQAGI